MKITKYVQAQRLILNLIASERLEKGVLLPSEKELSLMFDLSMITIRRALDELRKRAVVERCPGKGTFVLKTLEEDASLGIMAFIAVGNVLSPIYIDIFDALGSESLKRGYKLKYLKGNIVPDDYILRELKGVSAVVLCGSIGVEWFDFLDNNGIPVVVIGSNPKLDRATTIQHDWRCAVNSIIDLFVARGCSKIGFINTTSTYLPSIDMQDGFKEAVIRHGLQANSFAMRGEMRGKFNEITAFFMRHGNDFDALVVEKGFVFPLLLYYYSNKSDSLPQLGILTEKIIDDTPLANIVQTDFEQDICSVTTQVLFSLGANNKHETIFLKPRLLTIK